jgi:hypothetical protein
MRDKRIVAADVLAKLIKQSYCPGKKKERKKRIYYSYEKN